MTFAGFWVDGGVRKPEARHANALNHVVYQIKGRGEDSVAFFTANYKSIDSDCIWLDTTPRESLTPEELFSLLKVIWPSIKSVKRIDATWFVDDVDGVTAIAWGDLQQYPALPVEVQWIRIARENVAQYLFQECRFKDCDGDVWFQGKIAGWCETENRCLVHSNYSGDMPVMVWNIVEVQNAPTS